MYLTFYGCFAIFRLSVDVLLYSTLIFANHWKANFCNIWTTCTVQGAQKTTRRSRPRKLSCLSKCLLCLWWDAAASREVKIIIITAALLRAPFFINGAKNTVCTMGHKVGIFHNCNGTSVVFNDDFFRNNFFCSFPLELNIFCPRVSFPMLH